MVTPSVNCICFWYSCFNCRQKSRYFRWSHISNSSFYRCTLKTYYAIKGTRMIWSQKKNREQRIPKRNIIKYNKQYRHKGHFITRENLCTSGLRTKRKLSFWPLPAAFHAIFIGLCAYFSFLLFIFLRWPSFIPLPFGSGSVAF